MKTIILLLSIFLMTGTCLAADGNTVVGSGKVIVQERAIQAFTEVELRGVFDADISCNKGVAFKISGDDNIVALIRSEVKNGKLLIYSTKSYTTESPLKVTLSTPLVKKVDASGSNTVSVYNVTGPAFEIGIEGSSVFTVEGKTGKLSAVISGGSTLHADGLTADAAFLDISGAGDAEVTAVKKLDVTISGVGNVLYRGNPIITRHISGIGNISPK